MAEGSVQGIAGLPDDVRQIYRTVWEIPMRSLVDMAADRGALLSIKSQSLNLFIENPNIGQLSSMYFYAWKKGLKTTYYLRSRPATRIAKATVDAPAPPRPRREPIPTAIRDGTPVPSAAPGQGRGRRRLLAREPRDVRVVPVSYVSARPATILDPGMCLTLRPMAYPAFFDMYRDAIKNTWTVEEVDFATDVGDLRNKMSPAERHLVQRLVAFFATGRLDRLQQPRHRTSTGHINAPEARMHLCRGSSTRRRSTFSST